MQPTREDNLLDLALSDIEGIRCKVLPRIADHDLVLVSLAVSAPKSLVLTREVWHFGSADWDNLKLELGSKDWSEISRVSADEGALLLTDTILNAAAVWIPRKMIKERKSTHPWMNDRVLGAVAAKQAATGMPHEKDARGECATCIIEEYHKHVNRQRAILQKTKQNSKPWWTITRRLLQQKGTTSNIPALKNEAGDWLLEPKQKADLFANTLDAKYVLPAEHSNEYSVLAVSPYRMQDELSTLKQGDCEEVLLGLRVDSGTGPDLLPTRILKTCGTELALPVLLLLYRIIETSMWPASWLVHCIVPLHKKKSVYNTGNYRGIHLTAQLSKVAERLLQRLFVPYLYRMKSFGPNQFAYTRGRGARDAWPTLR
jgi:hypothetical protein